MKKIKIAFAVGESDKFEAKHFGDADKFLFYEYLNNELTPITEIKNQFKNLDKENKHGSIEKGNAIIDLLKENETSILVSKQFGKNIKMINKHFIPVIISDNNLNLILEAIKKHIKWIIDELEGKKEEYKLFTIKEGVIKSIIK